MGRAGTGTLQPGFVYSTGQAAAILGTTQREVVRMCDSGDLWAYRGYGRSPRRIALDIEGTEQLLGHSTAKSRRARHGQY